MEKTTRTQALEKVARAMSSDDREALKKGLKAFLALAQADKARAKKRAQIEALREQGLLTPDEAKRALARIGQGLLANDEAQALAWVRSQAGLVLKALEAIEASGAKEAKKAS